MQRVMGIAKQAVSMKMQCLILTDIANVCQARPKLAGRVCEACVKISKPYQETEVCLPVFSNLIVQQDQYAVP